MRFLVISIMKDEAPFLLEWLAHHRAVGFTDFLIFTHDCTDGTDHMLDRLDQLNVVTHRRLEEGSDDAWSRALADVSSMPEYAAADWVYVAEADEFLCIKPGHGKLPDLIAAFPDADVIPLTRRHFSTSGSVVFPFGNICERYRDAEPASASSTARSVRSVFRRSRAVARITPHAPEFGDGQGADINWGSVEWQANRAADPTKPKAHFGYDIAQVNRYAIKSVDAFLVKWRAGHRGQFGSATAEEYWDHWNIGGQEDFSIDMLAAERARNLEELQKDPLTDYLHKAAASLTSHALQGYVKEPELAALRASLVIRSDRMKDEAKRAKIAAAMAEQQAPPPVQPEVKPVVPEERQAKKQEAKKARHINRRRLLGLMPKNGRCAEIGVWKGDFSEEILEITEPEELTLIDPWGLLAEGPSDDWNHRKHGSSDAMDSMYELVRARFEHRGDVKICKGFSASVLAGHPDGYFDWVYIDGNHQYEFVKADIEMCFRKVREGGVIAGDDFHWKRNGTKPVRDAVLDVLKEHEIDAGEVLSRYGQQFMISVPVGSETAA